MRERGDKWRRLEGRKANLTEARAAPKEDRYSASSIRSLSWIQAVSKSSFRTPGGFLILARTYDMPAY